jgi:hypothetical protein
MLTQSQLARNLHHLNLPNPFLTLHNLFPTKFIHNKHSLSIIVSVVKPRAIMSLRTLPLTIVREFDNNWIILLTSLILSIWFRMGSTSNWLMMLVSSVDSLMSQETIIFDRKTHGIEHIYYKKCGSVLTFF